MRAVTVGGNEEDVGRDAPCEANQLLGRARAEEELGDLAAVLVRRERALAAAHFAEGRAQEVALLCRQTGLKAST